MLKITTKSGQVLECDEAYATVSRAMQNKSLLEIKVKGGKKLLLNPETIESIEADREETNSLYKQNYKVNNFPFKMTDEETIAMQNKLQPMKILFDLKKQAMEEMKAKEDATINASYKAMYGDHIDAIAAEKERSELESKPIEPVKVTEPIEEVKSDKPRIGRPPKQDK